MKRSFCVTDSPERKDDDDSSKESSSSPSVMESDWETTPSRSNFFREVTGQELSDYLEAED